jgi:hypothetical protein
MDHNLNKNFGILSSGRPLPVKKSSTHGHLCIDGRIQEHNLPWAILGHLWRTKYGHINKNRIKIVAVVEK